MLEIRTSPQLCQGTSALTEFLEGASNNAADIGLGLRCWSWSGEGDKEQRECGHEQVAHFE